MTTPDQGWGNEVFGAGVLRYPQIMSPNFNLANPSASPANSWALLQNGLAYIFGLVLSGGTITGPDYIINTSGIFIYSGTPALGNLIGSWAGSAGTDAFGNVYPQGFNVTMGAISGTTFTGNDFVINTSGAFFYSSTPALGNLICSVTSVAGTDGFGNAYHSGVAVYGSSSAYIQLATFSGQPQLKMLPGGVMHSTEAGFVYINAINAGLANEQQQIIMTSGQSGHDSGGLVINSESADGTVGANAWIGLGATTPMTWNENNVLVAANQPLGLQNSTTPTALPGYTQPFSDNNGALAYTDAEDTEAYKTGRRTLYLTSNTGSLATSGVTTIAALSSLVGLDSALRAYRIHGQLLVQAVATGAEVQIQINLPSGSDGQFAYFATRSTFSTFGASVSGGINANVGLAISLTMGNVYIVVLDGIFTITGNGTMNFQVGSLTVDALQLNKFSFIEIMPL